MPRDLDDRLFFVFIDGDRHGQFNLFGIFEHRVFRTGYVGFDPVPLDGYRDVPKCKKKMCPGFLLDPERTFRREGAHGISPEER